MKLHYLLFTILIVVFNSCSSTDSKLQNELTNEIGVKPFIITGTQDVKYVWKYVSLEKSKTIKNSIDRILNVLPIKDSGITSYQNAGKPTLFQYLEWETPNIKVGLDYAYNNDYDMDVALVVTNK